MMKKIFKSKFWLLIIVVLLLFVNWLATVLHYRIDLTGERRFTLGVATKKLLKTIDEPVTIDVFLKTDLPSGFKQLAAASEDILREFKEVAGNKIDFRFITADEMLPGTDVKYADTLAALGFYPINLTSQLKEGQQQQFVYPAAVVHYREKIALVELYKGKTPMINFADLNSAGALLEYNFANAISKVMQKEKITVGFATGNGEPQDIRTYDLVENHLKKEYRLFTFDLNNPQFVPAEFKALIIVKPTIGFTEIAKLKLDQFVMNGGKLILFEDRLNAEMDSLQIVNQVTAFDRDLKLNDLLFNYGVRVNADLLMDLQCDYLPFDVNGNGQFELLPWNYFPVMESKNNHPINKGLGFVSGKFVNSIDTVEAEGIQKTIILSSSANARTIGSPAVVSGAENVNAPEDAKYKKRDVPTAVLLQGKFQSLYKNRLSRAMSDSMNSAGVAFLPECIKDNKIIIVADGDVVLNGVSKAAPLPMGVNQYTFGTQREFPFANAAFVKNCLDFLVSDDGLADAKAKDYVVRLLDNKKVEDQKLTWQIINIAVPVLIVLFFAFIFQWLRKRKYAK